MKYSRKTRTRRTETIIKKSFSLSLIKKSKGKIEVNFEEITKVSPYIKEETNNLLASVLEVKLADSIEESNETIESLTGGAHE